MNITPVMNDVVIVLSDSMYLFFWCYLLYFLIQ